MQWFCWFREPVKDTDTVSFILHNASGCEVFYHFIELFIWFLFCFFPHLNNLVKFCLEMHFFLHPAAPICWGNLESDQSKQSISCAEQHIWQNFAACRVGHDNLVLLIRQMNQTCIGRRNKCMHSFLYFFCSPLLTAFQFQSLLKLDDILKEESSHSDFTG